MHESGYYENSHQETGEETVVIVSAGTFEIPIERDGTLLLSSIQTQIPFASGLWYWSTDLRRKRAIKYDKSTSKLYPPANGWGERTYYVSLLDNPHAGCVSGFGLDRYERATRLFQDSVHSVSRLIGVEFNVPAIGFQEQDTLKTLKEENEKLKESLTISRVSEAPVADTQVLAELQAKCDRLVKELENKDRALKNGEKNKDEIELQLSKLMNEFENAKAKVAELENAVHDKEREKSEQSLNFYREKSELEFQLADYEKRLNEFRTVDSSAQLGGGVFRNVPPSLSEYTDRRRSTDSEDFTTESAIGLEQSLPNSSVIEELQNELEKTKRNLKDLQSEYTQLQSTIPTDDDSHGDLLALLRKQIEELKARCTELESIIGSKDNEINRLNDRNRQLQEDFDRTKDELAKCQFRCKQLEDTVHALHQFSVHMKKQADDAKWRCGELEGALKNNNPHILTQMSDKLLNDAKWRCGELEAELNQKNAHLNELTKHKSEIENKFNEVQRNFDEAKRNFHEILAGRDLQEKKSNDNIENLQHEITTMKKHLSVAQSKLSEQNGIPERYSENEIIERLQNQLDEAQQNYTKLFDDSKRKMDQHAEDSKWRYYELETSVRMLNKELEEQQVNAANKEFELRKVIDEKCREIEELKQRLF